MSNDKIDPTQLPKSPRDLLGWLVLDVVEDEATRSERLFYADDFDGAPIPEGKAVKVTFEYVDAGELCDGGDNSANATYIKKGPK